MNEYFPCSSVVEASTVPCGLISTTTTFAIGLPLASLTCPVIEIVTRLGAIISPGTGDVLSEVCVGASGVGLALGSGVASG